MLQGGGGPTRRDQDTDTMGMNRYPSLSMHACNNTHRSSLQSRMHMSRWFGKLGKKNQQVVANHPSVTPSKYEWTDSPTV